MNAKLNRTDAWFLLAMTRSRGPMELSEFVNTADYLNRLIPTFDEVRFSLPRLVAAGYVTAARDSKGRLTIQPTDAGLALRARLTTSRPGDDFGQMATFIGAAPYPTSETEDLSLGPLAGFEAAEWDAAVTKNADWMTREVRKFLPGYTAPGSSRDIPER